MFRLRTLGTFGLTDAAGANTPLPPHRLALLALLAASGDRGMARDKILAYLWPDSTTAKARASLEQMLHALRVSLGDRSLLLGNPIRLDPAIVSSDVGEFRQALAAGELERAATLYQGPFLDGFYLSGVPEFEQWVTGERSRLEAQYVSTVEKLAIQAAARGEHARTMAWIRALGSATVPSAGAARRFMAALAGAGNRDAALEFAAQYGDRVRAEHGVEIEPSVATLAEQLRGDAIAVSANEARAAESIAPAAGDQSRNAVVGTTSTSTARYGVAVVAGVFVLVLLVGWVWRNRSQGPRLDPNVIAVMPFRVVAPDSSFNYLREGVIDLLNARLAGGGEPRVLHSRTLLVAWRRAVGERSELTEQESVALARSLGAGQLLLGSLVVTADEGVLTASLRDVATGRELLPYREESGDEALRLVDRLTRALLARNADTANARSPPLSDSLEAVKEYLAGVRLARGNQWAAAGRHYSRALNIDSTFALAALKQWEAILEGSASPRPAGPPFTDADFALAWSLRDRLSTRDQLNLKALGTYYLHSDAVSNRAATEAAAHAAPDYAKAWTIWGRSLTLFASLLDGPTWPHRAAAVLDSAIALDSTNAEPLRHRLRVALYTRNSADVHNYLRLIERLGPSGDDTDGWRWAAAQALGDNKSLESIRRRLEKLSRESFITMAHEALIEGLPLSDVQDALERRRTHVINATQFVGANIGWQFHLLAARGRVSAALALADSAMRMPNLRLPLAERVVRQALLEPGVGYDSTAEHISRWLGEDLAKRLRSWDQVSERSAFCLTNILQLIRGDSSLARSAIDRVRSIADASPVVALRETRGGSCPALLETLMDLAREGRERPIDLQSLDSLLSRGLYWDRTAPTAAVLLTRLHELQHDYPAALAASRRRNRGSLDYQVSIWPAVLRLEGRLAATVADTAGAIRAYTHYLTLRDKPDPGPMAQEVAEVRAHLAQLRRVATR